MKVRKMASILVVSIALVMSMISPASATSVSQFEDCDDSAWYVPALEYAIDNEIMYGVGGNYMEPNRNITRAEFVTMLDRLFDTYMPADITGYTDVSPDAWYYNEMAMGVQMGIIAGISDTELAPDAPLTREQAVTILARIMSLPDGNMEALEQFPDCEQISGWAVGSAAAMVIQDRLRGYDDGTVRPQRYITRAETAQLLMNCFPFLIDGTKYQAGEYTDNMLILAGATDATSEVINSKVKATMLLTPGLADGIVNIKGTNIGRLVCWGSHDVYIYPGCTLDELTLSRTDGPCIVHWLGDTEYLPKIYFTDGCHEECAVVDKDGNVLRDPFDNLDENGVPLSETPENNRPVYVYRPRAYFVPQKDGSQGAVIQYLGQDSLLVPIETPEWEGHVFGGWYYEPECETRFSFTQPVADQTYLYGKWYTDAQWAIVEQLNAIVNAGKVKVDCEADLLATIGADTIPCMIHNSDVNEKALTVTVVLKDTGAVVAVIDHIAEGETATEMRVIEMPEYGNYEVKIICQDADGQGKLEIEGMLYVAYMWLR